MPHEKVRAWRESEVRGPQLVCLVQTQSTLCASVSRSVFAQQDMALAADGVSLFYCPRQILLGVCVCARARAVFFS